jgi:hypothetical protein
MWFGAWLTNSGSRMNKQDKQETEKLIKQDKQEVEKPVTPVDHKVNEILSPPTPKAIEGEIKKQLKLSGYTHCLQPVLSKPCVIDTKFRSNGDVILKGIVVIDQGQTNAVKQRLSELIKQVKGAANVDHEKLFVIKQIDTYKGLEPKLTHEVPHFSSKQHWQHEWMITGTEYKVLKVKLSDSEWWLLITYKFKHNDGHAEGWISKDALFQ